jgi:hypothetical protein
MYTGITLVNKVWKAIIYYVTVVKSKNGGVLEAGSSIPILSACRGV